MIILDTNIVSELMRETPDARVADWLSRQKPLQFALTTITIAEIQRGLKRLPNGKRRSALERNFAAFVERGFEGRVLPFDMASAMIYGEVCALRESAGLHADPLDLMIAAIAKLCPGVPGNSQPPGFRGLWNQADQPLAILRHSG